MAASAASMAIRPAPPRMRRSEGKRAMPSAKSAPPAAISKARSRTARSTAVHGESSAPLLPPAARGGGTLPTANTIEPPMGCESMEITRKLTTYRPSRSDAGSDSVITSLLPCGALNSIGLAEPVMRRTESGLTGSVKRSSTLEGGAGSAAPSAGIEAARPACPAAPPVQAAASASSQRPRRIGLRDAPPGYADVVEDHRTSHHSADDAVVVLRQPVGTGRRCGRRFEGRIDSESGIALGKAAVHERLDVRVDLLRDFDELGALHAPVGRKGDRHSDHAVHGGLGHEDRGAEELSGLVATHVEGMDVVLRPPAVVGLDCLALVGREGHFAQRELLRARVLRGHSVALGLQDDRWSDVRPRRARGEDRGNRE